MLVPNAISVSQLYPLLGTPQCPVIIDVRIAEDFNDDPKIIPGAIKRNFDDIDLLAEEFVHQEVVIYCQKGFKISQGTAALLRRVGVVAKFLTGGQFAWRDADFPMVTASAIPRDMNESESLWVTPHRPKITGIACPWLIKRFIDPKAKFLFVEPSQVMNVAERFNATAFDIEEGQFSHSGEQCSFDRMLEAFALNSNEALMTLAQIVRGADNNLHDLAPEVSGLLAVSEGLSQLYQNDLELLEAGMLIYDAYYHWARCAKDNEHEGSTIINTPTSS